MTEILFYIMIYFIIGAVLSSINYFYCVFKDKNNYDIIEGPGEEELIVFLCFPLFLASILVNYWFSFLKWLALRFRK